MLLFTIIMIQKEELKRYSRTCEECKEFVSPHATFLVRECHDILDGISESNLDIVPSIDLETNLIILRNIFAFDRVLEPLAWEEKGLVAALQRIVDVYFDINGSVALSSTKLRRLVSQVIANASTSSEEWCRAMHQSMFPNRYMSLSLTDCSEVGDALALSLYNMCLSDRGEDGIMDSLVDANGCLVLSMLLQTEANYGDNDSLSLLLSYLCFRKNRLQELFSSLSESPESMDYHPGQWLNSNHAYLITKLASDVSSMPSDQDCSNNPLIFIHSLILRLVSEDTVHNECTKEVLRNALHCLREALAQPEKSSSNSVKTFLQHDMVGDYVSMLKALQGDQTSSYVHEQPYKGYKADVLSILANASFRARAVQQCILDQGALYPILACARGDPDAPLSREWALWSIRNLCECSAEARASIESLEKTRPSTDGGDSVGEYEITRGPEGFKIKMK